MIGNEHNIRFLAANYANTGRIPADAIAHAQVREAPSADSYDGLHSVCRELAQDPQNGRKLPDCFQLDGPSLLLNDNLLMGRAQGNTRAGQLEVHDELGTMDSPTRRCEDTHVFFSGDRVVAFRAHHDKAGEFYTIDDLNRKQPSQSKRYLIDDMDWILR